ncbi:hypothetical protein K4A83_17080 [Spirulina subsalsa FACHB-351]|uniref:Uncharacterized protein n=1 Tax=Spirulina subsalsa FACHB-351 TaxID=234711 RepID=A0ABT3LA33_9CYAN|nr:hypothetical protein [Spirulina subsalsa]MCW6037974.1 hypothetical protein [Spirulina subsalsa FACHB-351]
MAALIYPHLFCFSYHRYPVNQAQGHPTWGKWQKDHEALQVSGQSDYYQDKDWEAIYGERDLGDTMGLLLYGAVREEEKPQPLEVLEKLKGHLAGIEGSIGQSWLVITRWRQQIREETEEQVFQEILKLWNVEGERLETGRLVGNSFCSTVLPSGEHLLVILAPDRETMLGFSDFYYELQRLFYYEHKVRWSYEQSRKIKALLSQEAFFPLTSEVIPPSQIDLTTSQAVRGNFQELRRLLYDNMQKLDRHTRGIEGLSLQLQTLKTNLKAYQRRFERLQRLTADARYIQPSDLKLWADFGDSQGMIYQEQIQQDIESLSPGLRVREQHIKTLQVIVDAARGERDSRVENLIGAAGVGIGVSSAAAGAWSGQTSRPLYTFGLSLGLGLALGLVSYLVLCWVRGNPRE